MKIVRTEAVVQGCSVKKVFLKILQNSGTSVFLWILRNFSEHLFLCRAPPVTASVHTEFYRHSVFLITHNYILMFVLVKLLKWENIVFECIYKFSDKKNKAWVFGRNT